MTDCSFVLHDDLLMEGVCGEALIRHSGESRNPGITGLSGACPGL